MKSYPEQFLGLPLQQNLHKKIQTKKNEWIWCMP
jgi:hypothetical protein